MQKHSYSMCKHFQLNTPMKVCINKFFLTLVDFEAEMYHFGVPLKPQQAQTSILDSTVLTFTVSVILVSNVCNICNV